MHIHVLHELDMDLGDFLEYLYFFGLPTQINIFFRPPESLSVDSSHNYNLII
jgi:hypothetical protein